MDTSSSTSAQKQIFILSGQSNMAGRGGVDRQKHWDGVVPPECSPDPSRVFRLNARLDWEAARVPLHYDIDTKKTCGVGPGMPFANAVKEHIVGAIGLVPCAVGGTAIKEWARGGHLYNNMVERAKAASRGGGGELKALLWYQGESDTSSARDVEAYKESLETLIRNVRSDLNSPSLPVIQVAIASGDIKYLDKIREIQKGIDIPNVVTVDAYGLQLKEDNLHLTTEAQVRLGCILAQAHLANFKCE
ncbi:probable carbohydrate esterase At4g34215 [Andrographis paniculata]|uniref:probable carbohydrate esterase At4g34215 n=1 Tax=Andrographis paniculata TaxID=175694 RepID=UPI0021E8CDEA|nr:probable carbohydrate esterase At4g34215 [Andrographis paniculata]